MVVLNFTLTPEAASKVHDLLICLGKFSDTVAIEARRERVCLRHFCLARDLASHFDCLVQLHRTQHIQVCICRYHSRL
jgi:hypothetical protein